MLSADTSGQLDVLAHECHTLSVEGAQVGVIEETDEVSLASLLQSHHDRAKETQISHEVSKDLTHQTLE